MLRTSGIRKFLLCQRTRKAGANKPASPIW
jgi:hypothetical protein